jgi:nucleoid DNA-binding protein
MTRAQLLENLATTLSQTKTESERTLEGLVEVLKQAMHQGEKVDIRGLGVFKVRESKARQGRNPSTGAVVNIPAKKTAVFKPGKELAALMNPAAESKEPAPAA